MTSSDRQGWRILLRLAAITAVAFALVAALRAAPPRPHERLRRRRPRLPAAAAKCTAQILKGSKLVPVSERYYKFAFKKIKGTKKYRKVIVTARRKVKVELHPRQCVRTKSKKTEASTGTRPSSARAGRSRSASASRGPSPCGSPIYTSVKKTVTVKRGNRIVKVKKKVRVYIYEKCKSDRLGRRPAPR